MYIIKSSSLACKDASYVTAIEQSYPFHPELFNLLTKKIASIPNFQKTRGALRLFAQVVRYLWQHQDELTDPTWIPLIHPHHIPIGISDEITNDLTTRLEREYRAINNILSSQSRLEDLSESQQKELEKRKGIKDLEVRVALTNTYRHLFYPAQDPVKAPQGLLHYINCE